MLASFKALIYLQVLTVVGILLFRMLLLPQFKRLIDMRTIVLILVVPALFFVSPNIWIPLAVIPVALIAGSRSRSNLAANYLALLILVPALADTIFVGGTTIWRVSSDSALGIGAFIGLLILPRGRKFGSPMLDALVGGLCILYVIADARGYPSTQIARAGATAFFTIAVPYLVMSRCVSTRADARAVILNLYFAGFVSAFITMFEVARHWSLYFEVADNLGVAIEEGTNAHLDVRAGLNRAQGAFRNSSGYGVFMAVLVVGLLGVRHWFRPLMFWGLAGALALGLLLAQSRGAWLGAGAGYLAYCLYRRSYVQAAAIATAGIVGWVAMAALPRSGFLAEALGISGNAALTADYRRLVFEEGLRQAMAHPWIGQSNLAMQNSLDHLRQGEGIIDLVNTPLLIFLQLGVFGFLVWLLFWIAPLMLSWQGRPRGRTTPDRALMYLPPAIIIVCFTALVFTSPYNRTMFWPLLAAGLTVPLIRLARESDAPARRAVVPQAPSGGEALA